jgi:hypothetical protein
LQVCHLMRGHGCGHRRKTSVGLSEEHGKMAPVSSAQHGGETPTRLQGTRHVSLPPSDLFRMESATGAQTRFKAQNKISLNARLYAQGIPSMARRWIRSFIKLDDFETAVEPLENAGLAQGSPLSPILFAFFNFRPRGSAGELFRRRVGLH